MAIDSATSFLIWSATRWLRPGMDLLCLAIEAKGYEGPRRRPGSITYLLQSTSDFLNLKDLELIAFFDVIEVFQRQTALEARLHLFDVIFEAL